MDKRKDVGAKVVLNFSAARRRNGLRRKRLGQWCSKKSPKMSALGIFENAEQACIFCITCITK